MDTMKAKICARRDTTANWAEQTSLVPLLGEIIVYVDHGTITDEMGNTVNVPGFKVGDGVNVVGNLPFVSQDDIDDLREQIAGCISATDPVFEGSISMGRKEDTDVGEESVALGYEVEASGDYSQAEGTATSATGDNAHAEGFNTTASGSWSHAEGSGSEATSTGAHAEGTNTSVTGDSAHAEGLGTIAAGSYSHASGMFNVADSYADWPEWQSGHHYDVGDKVKRTISGDQGDTVYGYVCLTANSDQLFNVLKWTPQDGKMNYAEVVGNGTSDQDRANARTLDWEGNERLAGDLYVNCTNANPNGQKVGTQAAIDLKADKADTVLDTTLSRGRKANTTVGSASFAFGYNVTASGNQSHAEGSGGTASGTNSHVEGATSTASGDNSHAEGEETSAGGRDSHAEGYRAITTAQYAHAEGSGTTASGEFSHAEGGGSTASGISAHAEGGGTTASGYYSHAEGGGAKASNYYAHAEGNETKATAPAAHAEGSYATASGTYSHAEGYNTIASGYEAHAEGYGGTYTSGGTTYTSAAVGTADHTEGYLCLTVSNQPGNHAEGYQTQATGGAAHSEGQYSIASGAHSHAEGTNTVASAQQTHAEGIFSTASAQGAHAEGFYTLSDQTYAHAEGYRTIAHGTASHAEGQRTIDGTQTTYNNVTYTYGANGVASHAEGSNTVANANYSHAEGMDTFAIGRSSHVEGAGSHAVGQDAHAEGNGTTASGGSAHAEGAGTNATGYASHAEGSGNTASGERSHTEGSITTASGSDSHAEGQGTTASGAQTHAEGYYTTANSMCAHAEGYYSSASGNYAHAEGYYAIASGMASHAEGYRSSNNSTKTYEGTVYSYGASGQGSHSEGSDTIAYSNYTHAEGNATMAIAFAAHAEGTSTVASGSQSHAEGVSTKASGGNSHAEGAGTIASGGQAHAEGAGTTASGYQAHAEGGGTTASGAQSHAEGSGTAASGAQAHAEGGSTIAAGTNSHVSGMFNVADSYDNWPEWAANTSYAVGDKVKRTTTSNNVTTVAGYVCNTANSDSSFNSSKWTAQNGLMNYAEIVGNGGSSARSNARALDWEGNEYLSGSVYVGCGTNSTGGTKLATETFVTGKMGTANGIAELDENGKVPSSQLPSYVDDVEEYDSADVTAWTEWVASTSYAVGDKVKVTETEDNETTVTGYICNTANSSSTFDPEEWDTATVFPATGESGKIYIALDTNVTYRWGGSTYVAIGSSLALGETESTAYRGDRGAAAYAAAVTNVESSPSSGSSNLITSGAVYTGLSSKAPTDSPVFTGSISLDRATNTTVGSNSFAVGSGPEASGTASHAEGNYTKASGNFGSHAEGNYTTASGNYGSHAEGDHTTASGKYSHAEGTYTTASKVAAHAEGQGTNAIGDLAHAEGYYTIAQRKSQHVFGEYNVSDTSGTATTRGAYVEIVGNGASGSNSNARALDWNGNEYLKGDVYVGCDADSTNGSKLARVSELPFVKVADYGAVGDGETDDSTAIQAAVNAGYDIYFESNKTYYIASPISIHHDIYLHGGENTTIKTVTPSGGTVINGIYISGQLKKTTTLTTNYSKDGTTANSNNRFTLSDMTDISIGDIMVITATDQYYSYARPYYYLGASLLVTDVYNGHIYTNEGMPFSITNTENVSVKIYSAPTAIIENLHFVSDLDSLGAYKYLLTLETNKNSVVRNCTFSNMVMGVNATKCVNLKIDGITFAKSKYDNSLNGDGYGLVVDSCTNTVIERVISTCGQHAISITGNLPAINTYIKHCELTSECRSPGLDTHEPIYNLVVEDSVLGTAALNGTVTINRCRIINNRRFSDESQAISIYGSHNPEWAKFKITNTEFEGTGISLIQTGTQNPVQTFDCVWESIEIENCSVGSVSVIATTNATILSNTIKKIVICNCPSVKEIYHSGTHTIKQLIIDNVKFTQNNYINAHADAMNFDNIEYIDIKNVNPEAHKIRMNRTTYGECISLPQETRISVSAPNSSAKYIVCGKNVVSDDIEDYVVGTVSGSAGGTLSRSPATGDNIPTISMNSAGNIVYSQGNNTTKYCLYPVGMFYVKETSAVTVAATLVNSGETNGSQFYPFIAVVNCNTGKVVDRYSGTPQTASSEGTNVSYSQMVGGNCVALCYFYCNSPVSGAQTTFENYTVRCTPRVGSAIIDTTEKYVAHKRTGDGDIMSLAGLNNIMCSSTVFSVMFVTDYLNKPTYLQGATASSDGITGLVPAPSSGDNTKFLKGDGTWATAGADLGLIAAAYDSTATYSENDYCTHEGGLYKANQDISTAEAWTAAHWTQTTVMAEIIARCSIIPAAGVSF